MAHRHGAPAVHKPRRSDQGPARSRGRYRADSGRGQEEAGRVESVADPTQTAGDRRTPLALRASANPLRASRCDDLDERFYKARDVLGASLQGALPGLEAGRRHSSIRGERCVGSDCLTPEKGQPPSRDGDDSRSGEPRLRIELRGNLAAMLAAAQQTKRSPETGDLHVPIQLVAGAGFEPATFGL